MMIAAALKLIDKGFLDERKINKALGYEEDEDQYGRAADGLTDEERMERIRKLSAPEASGHGEHQEHQQEQEQQQGEGEQQGQNVKRTRSKLGFRSRRPSHANGEDASKKTVSTYDAIGDKFKVPQSSFSMSLQ